MRIHIRKPARRSRSTQWYRDHSSRDRGTYCGAPCGEGDVAWTQRAASLTGDTRFGALCTACNVARAEDPDVTRNPKGAWMKRGRKA